MNPTEDSPITGISDSPDRPAWSDVLPRLVIWGLFFVLVYLTRDFFFVAFMTFMISYVALAVVGWVMRRLSPDQQRPGMRRLVTLAVFVLAPLILLGVGALVVPRLIAQGQRLAGWLSQVSPETEVARLMEDYVGASEFRRHYGGPEDARYQKALEEFRQTGEHHVAAYLAFPKLEAWVETGFNRQFVEAESGRIRSRLIAEGTSSKEFEDWFRTEEFSELQARSHQVVQGNARQHAPTDSLVRSAATANPEQLLQQARRDPAALAALRQKWVEHALALGLAAAKQSPSYREQFRAYFDERRAEAPVSIPYTFEQYVELQKARPKGAKAFGDTLEALQPSPAADRDARLKADFETAKRHELFQAWWAESSSAKFIRHEVEATTTVGDGTGRLDRILSSLLSVPLDLSTALLLSFFICIDFPRLRRGCQGLRDTWLRGVYDEIAPALTSLALLVGRAMQAQGLIALCNATLMFLALSVLGVEHSALLAGAVFVLCLVPTLGMIISWVLLAAVALVQPGGGLILALKVTVSVLVVVLLETFVFSPRILGRMMELHPVVIISVLPLAQYFFGIWGLILATPVAVYVIYEVILRRGLPGAEVSDKPQQPEGSKTTGGSPAGIEAPQVTARHGLADGATQSAGSARLVTPAAE
jgi:predicted PurR-regulated permease PerM